jgi:hypothetical protein
MAPEGRFGDAWDEIQGRRVDEVPGGRVRVLLLRADFPGPWSVQVDVDADPAGQVLAEVEQEIVAAVRACGVPVAAVVRHP